MRIYFSFLFSVAILIQVNGQIDTGSTHPLQINTKCVTIDQADWSARKNVFDKDEYKSIQLRSFCDIDSFPSVDFNRYLLLSVSYSYSGCEKNVERRMIYSIDHANKKLVLRIVVYQKGPCRPIYYKWDIFKIPIIPDSYTIEIYKPGITSPEIIPGAQ